MINYIDGLTAGDGTEIGKCPNSNIDYKCLSTGACNVCGNVYSGLTFQAEGCNIFSTTPVCDADSTTSISDDTATNVEAKCVKCTKTSMDIFFCK